MFLRACSKHLLRCMLSACLALILFHPLHGTDISTYRDETFVELPYVYTDRVGGKLTPEVSVLILINPCAQYDAGCCAGTYGAMEYFPDYDGAAEFQTDRMCPFQGLSYPIECVIDRNGENVPYGNLRISDYENYFHADCKGDQDPFPECIGKQIARTRNELNPPCWDYNDTIDSRFSTCRQADGTEKNYCLEFAFSTNAFVMECRGDYESDLTCGTYVELHRTDERVENEELYFAQTKIEQGIYSGLNDISTGIDLTLLGGLEDEIIGDSVLGTKVLCRGSYELWWVQRTRYYSYVLYRKKTRNNRPCM
jgi:hypothetical protein